MDNKTKNPIIRDLKELSNLRIGNELQQAYIEQVLKDAKPIKCVPLDEVFTPAEIRTIKKVLRPKKHQCYLNSALMTELFPDKCKYVEGYGWNGIFKVEHAFNRVGNKYIDITWELALGYDVLKLPYVALIEADRDEIISDIQAHDNITGDYYLHTFLKNSNTTRQ